MSRKLHIITFGCQMNEADSERIGRSFAARGFELTDSLKAADAVVINTCTVRQRAEDKAISQIGRLRKWKLARPDGKLFVVGCAAEKLGRKYIRNRFPFVDEVVGAKSLDKIEALLPDFPTLPDFPPENRHSVQKHTTGQPSPLPTFRPPTPRLPDSPVSAFITIMRGCSLKCSYCIVPAVRGEASYLAPEEILAEAEAKIAEGAKELILLGQTVNSYSYKAGGESVSFARLLEKAAALPGLARLRFMSPHPLFFTDEFFRVFRENPRIGRYIHLPVQSGSDRILKAMRRGYTRARYLDIVAKIREAAPDAAVSTDFIVGYPGETEADFRESLSLIGEAGFSFAYCFKYSRRTDERGLEPDLDEAGMDERLERLLAEVKKNSGAILNARIGRIEEVLPESRDFGRTSANFVVRPERGAELEPGALVRMEITGVVRNALKGRPVP
ncbi:MAG TPA: tRNA (N6-isopentenyl adenosine(37)-C2)-methylthiotransferase MiaB [Elusimicrobiales bacterium]|nr:tRNA (N6-isopentenyl adenosine(37)-C2)-methylthiotransferase MiaB [Elusimicrobiales bacterium]